MANQKGGVGKSTTAVSLGAALAEIGYRVLVVDLDPQGNASTGLGIRHEAREVTVYDVLAAEAPIEGAVVATPVKDLFAIPSTIDLAGAEIELVSQFSREMRLRKALEPLRTGSYDFIFLDCPPSLGLLTVNALAAAEELIVPIQCEYYALEGLGQLLRNVRLVQQNVNPGLRLTGIVMTMFDPRTKLSEQVVQEVRRFFGERVYETIIPRTVRLSEAPGFGQPITVYDPKSRGATCYRDLAREVATRLPLDEPMPVLDEVPSVFVPPPEPVAMSAPRPLRREGVDVDVESADPQREAGDPGPDAVDLEAEAPPSALSAGPSEHDLEPLAGPAQDEMEGPEDAVAREGDIQEPVEAVGEVSEEVLGTSVGQVRDEAEVETEPRLDAEVTEPADLAGASGGADSEPPLVDEARIPEPTPPVEGDMRASHGVIEQDEGSDSEPATDEPPRKRRWGLFRRGGSG